MSKVIELAREAGAYYTYVDPHTGRESRSLPERCFETFYTLARADLEAENAKLRFALNYIQAQTHVGHIHDTASAALGETK